MSFFSRLFASFLPKKATPAPVLTPPVTVPAPATDVVVTVETVEQAPVVVVVEPPLEVSPTEVPYLQAPVAVVEDKPLIDPAKFAKFAPKAIKGTLPALEKAARKNKLTHKDVLAAWLGQMYEESGGFSVMMESLNYSSASLKKKFGRHRISLADCDRYGRNDDHPANQRVLANILYGGDWGRENLGNIKPNDGWDYRGAGYKQITGRSNQEKYGVTASELLIPDISADVAARFFVDKGCVPLAKQGNIREITRLINGGYNGLENRIAYTDKAREIIN